MLTVVILRVTEAWRDNSRFGVAHGTEIPALAGMTKTAVIPDAAQRRSGIFLQPGNAQGRFPRSRE